MAEQEKVEKSPDEKATRAAPVGAPAGVIAADDALQNNMEDLESAKADADRMKLDWERAQGLFKDALIAKSEYDMRKNAWEAADAGVAQAQARIAQAKAQKDSAEQRISESRANLTRVSDVLQKTTYA